MIENRGEVQLWLFAGASITGAVALMGSVFIRDTDASCPSVGKNGQSANELVLTDCRMQQTPNLEIVLSGGLGLVSGVTAGFASIKRDGRLASS